MLILAPIDPTHSEYKIAQQLKLNRADANAENSNVIQITAVKTMTKHEVRIRVLRTVYAYGGRK